MIDFKEISKSYCAGAVSGVTYLFVAYILDKSCGPQLANFIGLICGGILNFFLQSFVFNFFKKIDKNVIWKFIVTEVMVIISVQMLFMLIYKKKKYNSFVVRILISIFVGLVISYPMRKLWVFL